MRRLTWPSPSPRLKRPWRRCESLPSPYPSSKDTLPLPPLQVEKLDSSSISEVKAYTTPPALVGLVLSAVMTIFGVPTDWAR